MQKSRDVRDEIVARLMAAVPAGKGWLDDDDIAALRVVTAHLLEVAAPAGRAEAARFIEISNKSLTIDAAALDQQHNGRTVLVTGGTGCIGSSLLAELHHLHPGRLVSISRGVSRRWAVVPGVEYRDVDVRDPAGLARVFDLVQPDIVYHLAAQHEPGLAEVEVARTLSTNIGGTANVIAACVSHGVQLVHASTGKALRPFSRDIYAASKKLSEWLLAQAVDSRELLASAVRFTHVGDNSIIAGRLDEWARTGSPVRLHGPDVSFYLQSAREAAQLLLCLGLEATRGRLAMGAIRDLGWPISLLDLALGRLAESDKPGVLYICGFEAGYEVAPYPGLYDPRISGEHSPLFNAMEVDTVADSSLCREAEVCTIPAQHDTGIGALIEDLCAAAAADADPTVLRAKVAECGWAALSGTVEELPTAVLARQLDLVRLIPRASLRRDDQDVVDTVARELDTRLDEPAAHRTARRPGPTPTPEAREPVDAGIGSVSWVPHLTTGTDG